MLVGHTTENLLIPCHFPASSWVPVIVQGTLINQVDQFNSGVVSWERGRTHLHINDKLISRDYCF
jgi:hypothetical protein